LRILLLCVGRLGQAPEALLARSWAERAGLVGRAHGLAPVEVVEVEARGGKGPEGEALLRRAGEAHLIALDEHGQGGSSRSFAERLGALRDDGVQQLVFAIGGADGLSPAVLACAHQRLAFGPQTWPHALVRAMLAEQVYRAATLVAGQPYHRN
jgi:23S rRNA (pseudouridine1915-N3)-methyltransferase